MFCFQILLYDLLGTSTLRSICCTSLWYFIDSLNLNRGLKIPSVALSKLLAALTFKIKCFIIDLKASNALTGEKYSPAKRQQRLYLPLITAVFGGLYTADYFNVSGWHCVGSSSHALGVPLVVINRQGINRASHCQSVMDQIPSLPSSILDNTDWLIDEMLFEEADYIYS